MKVIRTFLKGQFEDAFLYRDRIVAVTANGTLQMLNLSQLAKYIESRAPQTIPIPTLVFQRNDWLSGKEGLPYRSLVRNPEIAAAVMNAARLLSEMEFDATEFLEKELPISNNDSNNIILDMNIYNGRLYLGTDNGLTDHDIDWDGLTMLRSRDRFDLTCMNISARYGTVNVSCGDDGLHSSVNDFDLQIDQQGVTTELIAKHDKFQVRANRSLKSSWCDTDIVNYADFTNPQLHSTIAQTVPSRFLEQYENRLLTAVSDTSQGIWHLERTQKKGTDISSMHVDYAYNAGQRFYLHTESGAFYEVKVIYPSKSYEPKLGSLSRLKDTHKGHIIKTLPLRKGAVVETIDKVLLLNAEVGIREIHSEPCLSVRTFPQSRRYRDLFLLVTSNGIWLNSVFSEDDLLPPEESAKQLKLPLNRMRRSTDAPADKAKRPKTE